MSTGPAAEAATHAAAAVWGLPDFMFLPITESIGSKTREIGDGIMLVADHGVVLQVKARDALSEAPDKEARWLSKQAGEALGQGNGTIRRMRTGKTTLTNLRGREVTIDGNGYDWTIVVVLDHDGPPVDVTPDLAEAKHPAVVLLRRDWQFLFDQLKSTHAVVSYLRRVAGEPLELGTEPERYYRLASADHSAPSEAIDPKLLEAAVSSMAMPTLPLHAAASEDRNAHRLIRAMCEEIAEAPMVGDSSGAGAPGESLRLRILGELDRLPVGSRARMGRYVLEAMDFVTADASGDVIWKLTSLRGNAGQAHLAYGACSHRYSEQIAAGFESWLSLRHHDVVSVTSEIDSLITAVILLTPSDHADRDWDTTAMAVHGDMDFSENDLRLLRQMWPYEGSAG